MVKCSSLDTLAPTPDPTVSRKLKWKCSSRDKLQALFDDSLYPRAGKRCSECAHLLHSDLLHVNDYGRSVLIRYTVIHYTSKTTVGVCSLATQWSTNHWATKSSVSTTTHQRLWKVWDSGMPPNAWCPLVTALSPSPSFHFISCSVAFGAGSPRQPGWRLHDGLISSKVE